MLSKEEWVKERDSGALSIETLYSYYVENKPPEGKVYDIGEFSMALSSMIQAGVVQDSQGNFKKITKSTITRKVIEYFNTKFGV